MSPATTHPLADVQALVFDVFGTVVDWRTSVVDELVLRAHRKALSASTPAATRTRLAALTRDDWARLAQQWRASYGAFTRSFVRGRDAWKSVDEHHRESIAALLAEWGLQDVYSSGELDSLALVWHRLAPWADAVDGLAALKRDGSLEASTQYSSETITQASSDEAHTHASSEARAHASSRGYTLATLSNANLALLGDLDDYGSLGFDQLFSAELFGAYKPDPATYRGAVERLGLKTSELAMVAAHLSDLEAARACGLRTVYVERPGEEAWSKDDERYTHARSWVDVWISDDQQGFLSLASQLLPPS